MNVTVTYWVGTTQHEGKAATYAEALALAGKNQNSYSPRFCDENGVELHDDGNGLAYVDEQNDKRVYAV